MTYDKFIQNILNTRGRFACLDGYHERHHIIPKCMNGSNSKDNLIDLYAREHFIAHKLLAEENPQNYQLKYAYWNMCQCTGRDGQNKYIPTPEEYEEARIFCHEAMSGENHPMYGKHYSEEVKKRMSESHKGQVPYNKGKSMSEVQKKKLSEAKNGKYSGKDSPRVRKVIRLSDCKIYDCGRFAAKDNNMSPSNMCNRCKQHNGFMYYDEYLITQQNDYKEE